MLSQEARAGRLREKLLERIEGIVRESVRPLEKIEGIKILHVDGASGGSSRRNVTDEVIDSALRYRVQAPMIAANPRHATGRDCAPPKYLAACASAMNAAYGAKSSAVGGRRINREVSRVGPSMAVPYLSLHGP